jgi:hypothetical protein
MFPISLLPTVALHRPLLDELDQLNRLDQLHDLNVAAALASEAGSTRSMSASPGGRSLRWLSGFGPLVRRVFHLRSIPSRPTKQPQHTASVSSR